MGPRASLFRSTARGIFHKPSQSWYYYVCYIGIIVIVIIVILSVKIIQIAI